MTDIVDSNNTANNIDNKLVYDDLMLGEKARDAYFRSESVEYIIKNCPVYLNTKHVFANLNVTDMASAAVIGGLNLLIVGDSGTGKTQLFKDIYNHHFNNNKKEGGHGIMIRGYRLIDSTLYDEVLTELNIEKGRVDLTDNIRASISGVDEINRAPEYRQNDALELGDGVLNHKGRSIHMGEEDYHILIATANLGNGEFSGTFNTDKALYNRLHVAIDFDYEMFKPTREDMMLIDMMRAADPRIKEAPNRDIFKKILYANNEIKKNSSDVGASALA